MAILKGIEASVIIDGKALTEYDDEDTPDESFDHTSEVSKYIEAVSDAEFSVSITAPRSYNFVGNALSFKINLDGIRATSYLYLKSEVESLRQDWHKTIAGSKVKIGKEWYLRPFKFDDIKIVEASTSTAGSRNTNSVANLGTITLEVFDREVARKSCSTRDRAVRLGQSSEIEEKKLKGRNVTLQATFGESRSVKESGHYKSKRTKPILSFKFNYRSRKALQGLHLIPRTPSPSPMPTPVSLEERPFDSLTPDEVQELARRLHAKYQAEREANIKPEKIKSERGVKREHDQEYEDMMKSSTAKRAKTRPLGQGETIELD